MRTPPRHGKRNAHLTALGREVQVLELLGTAGYRDTIYPILGKILDIYEAKCLYYLRPGPNQTKFADELCLGTENELQQWLGIHGIPNAHLLTTTENKILGMWACYALVLPSDLTAGHKQYSEEQILQILHDKLGLLQTSDSSWYVTHRTLHNQWQTLEEVRVALRQYGPEALHPRGSRMLNPEEKANVRVWAARSTVPLPVYDESATDEPAPDAVHDNKDETEQQENEEEEEEAHAEEGQHADDTVDSHRSKDGTKRGNKRAHEDQVPFLEWTHRPRPDEPTAGTNKRGFSFGMWGQSPDVDKADDEEPPAKRPRKTVRSWFHNFTGFFSSSRTDT